MPTLSVAGALAVLSCAITVLAAAQSVPATSIWQRIRYPQVAIPGTPREQLTFLVGSGGHKPGPMEEPSHLRLDLMWAGRAGVPVPASIARAREIVVRLHAGTAAPLTPASKPPPDLLGVSMGGWTNHALTSIFPWQRNALDEAWFEVRAGGQAWWVELPYGFARNPEATEIPDRTRDVPRFPPAMRPLGATDILVPWLAVEYDVGRTQSNALLTLKLSNPLDARASVGVYREPPMRVGPDTGRQNPDSPRIALMLEFAGRGSLAAQELARRLSDDRRTRTDDFTFNRLGGWAAGRRFGTFTITVDQEKYTVRAPSSLFAYLHGRTDPENRQWMKESR